MYSFSYGVLLFALYSCLGWICESIWCSAIERRPVNRGFMRGPWCPIYGFGAVLILLFAEPQRQSPILVFAISLSSATLLEYFTGWLMETLFKMRWWAYSNHRFNLKGRVCLANSLLFGIMGVASVYLIQPLMAEVLLRLSGVLERVLASILVVLFFFDLVRSVAAVARLDEHFDMLRRMVSEMEQYQRLYNWFHKDDVQGSMARLRKLYMEDSGNGNGAGLLFRLEGGGHEYRASRRLLNAFPVLKDRFSAELSALRGEFEAIWQQYRAELEKKGGFLQERKRRFGENVRQTYRNIDGTQMVWVFLIASVVGFVAETLFCLAVNGVLESRQGMLYGPFNQVYGFGGVLMVLALSPFARRGDRWLFAGGAVVGGLFEAACSFLQERLFGSVSWQYSGQDFSFFGGRTSLMYMFFWGILALIYMRHIYPRMTALIDRIPLRAKRLLTWTMGILLLANMLISAAAVSRWSDRVSGIPPRNDFQIWMDRRYPDEMLRDIYPTMSFVDAEARQVPAEP